MRRRKSFPELQDWDPPFQQEIIEHLSRFVKAVIACRPNEVTPEPWASAVPVVYAGQPILLTAAHVLQGLGDRQLFLEVPDRFQPITTSPALVAQNDAADAAAILLPNGSFDWGLDFLELDIQQEPILESGDIEIFLAMGFPVRETAYNVDNETVKLKIVNYRAFEHNEAYDLLDISRDNHVAICFDRKNSYHKGFVRAMKLPHGMSGGALWRFWGPDTEAPSPARGAFAGILTEYRDTSVKCMISARLGILQGLASRLV